MEREREISFRLNGHPVSCRAAARAHLGDLLRTEFGFTGVHIGCEHGVCGACTILVDGRAIRSCLMLAVQADGAIVETIEGLTESGRIADLQEAFHARNALQCGYCTPGQLCSGVALLNEDRAHSRAEIREAMSGNICRCGAYTNIVDAISDVIEQRAPRHKEAAE